jgi:AcrR family transcriptional regulator
MNKTNEKDKIEKIQEYLDVALELFSSKGYEKTTINDIINKLGVSKGAFYHYFNSKEDIIEAIAVGYSDRIGAIIRSVLKRNDLNAIEKFNMCFEETQEYKKRESERRSKIRGSMQNVENIKLQKKIMDKIYERYLVFFDQIVKEGIEQKLFNIVYCKELPVFLLKMSNGLKESIDVLLQRADEENMEQVEFFKELDDLLTFYEDVFKRVLNLKEHSIKIKQIALRK